MSIQNLPTGSKFRTVGPGSFQRKLSSISRYGGLKNLRDNIPAVSKVINKYKTFIKRGGLSRLQRISALQQIQKSDKNFTIQDKRDIKKILSHLSSKNNATTNNVPQKSSGGLFSGIFGRKKTSISDLTDQQKSRNIALSSIDFGSGDSNKFAGSAGKKLDPKTVQDSIGFKPPSVGFANKSTTGFAGQNR
ncbi:hypothetical protein KKC56_01745 [Patescibacteria group bacterium]|nr:hypothetical protein [Patescibacteria group bacterium]MBU1684167.1 hypothetical protein [Patescibacteria group bacterium]